MVVLSSNSDSYLCEIVVGGSSPRLGDAIHVKVQHQEKKETFTRRHTQAQYVEEENLNPRIGGLSVTMAQHCFVYLLMA